MQKHHHTLLRSLKQLGLITLVIHQSIFAQVNTESMRTQDLTPGAHYSLATNLSVIEGNSTIFQSKIKGRIDHVLEGGRWFFIANQKMSSKEDRLFINQGFAHLRFIRPFHPQLEGEIFLQQEYNEFINLQSRSLGGFGLRMSRDLFQSEINSASALRLTLGVGLMLEHESMDAGPDGLLGDPVHGELAKLLRSSNYLVLNWEPSQKMSLQSTTYYQVDTQRLADYRVLSQSQLKLDLSKRFALIFELNIRRDSEPPANIEGLDLEFTQGIKYQFK